MAASPIVLASASPRRKELLASLGLEFEIVPAEVDEHWEGEPDPRIYAEALARRKAQFVAAQRQSGLVIGADTLVYIDGEILTKPSNETEAHAMLHRLSGRTHTVVTGVAVVNSESDETVSGFEQTKVTFRTLSDAEIKRYVATGEPMDKAGAYGIQGIGALLVARIEGCYPNVVGLPLVRLAELLLHFGVELL